MKKKVLVVLAALLAALASVSPAGARLREGERARPAEKVKASVARLGTGARSRVEVRLRDKTKLKGYVSEAGDDHFTVVDEAGVANAVAYTQVAQVKGNNLSTGVRIAITVGLFAVLLALLANNTT